MFEQRKQIIKHSKEAISLVEVLVSVMLISVVIVSLLQIKENSLNFLQKSQERNKYSSYLSMISLDNNTKLKDDNIYLSDKVDFKDDEIRKELKLIKLTVKDELEDTIKFSNDEYTLQININKTNISIEDKISKQFYRFTLAN